jgi:hypothetical protein
MTRFLLLSDICGVVDMGRSLWREDGSVLYSCCWSSPEQSFSGPSPEGLTTITYCLRFETSPFVASYDSQGYGGGIRLSKSKLLVCYDRRSVGQSVLVSYDKIFITVSCRLVDVGRSLWRENGSAVYNCCWSSPAQTFLGPSPAGLTTIFYWLRLETSPTWSARSPYLYTPGTGWPSYTPRYWVPFSSPPTTRRATMIVRCYSRNIAFARPHRKHRFPPCCLSTNCRRPLKSCDP